MFVTRDQLQALHTAARVIANSRGETKSVRVFTVEVAPDAWGQSREYWVGSQPPEDVLVVMVVEVALDQAKYDRRHNHPYSVTEVLS
jgi:hypothetical protein